MANDKSMRNSERMGEDAHTVPADGGGGVFGDDTLQASWIILAQRIKQKVARSPTNQYDT